MDGLLLGVRVRAVWTKDGVACAMFEREAMWRVDESMFWVYIFDGWFETARGMKHM